MALTSEQKRIRDLELQLVECRSIFESLAPLSGGKFYEFDTFTDYKIKGKSFFEMQEALRGIEKLLSNSDV